MTFDLSIPIILLLFAAALGLYIIMIVGYIPGVIAFGLFFAMFMLRNKGMKRETMEFIGVIVVLVAAYIFVEYRLWFWK